MSEFPAAFIATIPTIATVSVGAHRLGAVFGALTLTGIIAFWAVQNRKDGDSDE